MEGVSSPHLQHLHSYEGTTAPITTLAAWPMDPCVTTVHGLHCIPSVNLSLPDEDMAVDCGDAGIHGPCSQGGDGGSGAFVAV